MGKSLGARFLWPTVYSTETTSKQPIFSFSQIGFSFYEHVAEVDQSLFQI